MVCGLGTGASMAKPSGSGARRSRWSFCSFGLSSLFQEGLLCTQLVIPAISVLGLYLLCCRYLTSHSGSSDTVAHHFYLVSTHFITFHLLSSHFITFHHILTSTLSIVCSPSITFFTASYPAGHSGPLGTSFPTLIYLTLTQLPTVSRWSFRLTRYPSPSILHGWLSLIDCRLFRSPFEL